MARHLLYNDTQRDGNWINPARLGLAILVVYSHCYSVLATSHAEPLVVLSRGQKTSGSVAVDLFFAISGLLILRSWLQSKSMEHYFQKRVLRIYPAYMCALVFTFVLALSSCPDSVRYLREIPWRQFAFSFVTLGYGALDVPDLAFPGNAIRVTNASLWTIQLEFYAYIFVAVYGLFSMYRHRITTLLFALFVFGFYEAKVMKEGDADAWWRFGACFVAGMLVCLFRDKVPRSKLLLIVSLVLLAVGLRVSPFFNALLPIAGTYALFYAVLSPAPAWVARFAKVDLSYGVYLFAFPIQQAVFYWFHPPTPAALFALALPATLLCALASWFLIEKRFLSFKNEVFDRVATIGATQATAGS